MILLPNHSDDFMDWESRSDSAVRQLQAHCAVVPPPQQPAQGQGINAGGTPPEGRSGRTQPQPLVWEVVWELRLYLMLQVQVEVVISQRGQ